MVAGTGTSLAVPQHGLCGTPPPTDHSFRHLRCQRSMVLSLRRRGEPPPPPPRVRVQTTDRCGLRPMPEVTSTSLTSGCEAWALPYIHVGAGPRLCGRKERLGVRKGTAPGCGRVAVPASADCDAEKSASSERGAPNRRRFPSNSRRLHSNRRRSPANSRWSLPSPPPRRPPHTHDQEATNHRPTCYVPSTATEDKEDAHGCIRREGTSEEPPEAVRQAVGGGCLSGWGAVTVGYKCHWGWHWPLGKQWLGVGWASRGGAGGPPPFPMHP